MLETKCPKCGEGIRWWPDELFQPSGNKRECVSCGERFELINPAVCAGANGLIFACIMIGLTYVGLRYEWLRVLAAGFVCWLIHPFIVCMFGRWRSRSYRSEDSSKARAWAQVGCVSGWVFGIAAVFTVIGFGLLYRNLVMELTGGETNGISEAMGEYVGGVMIVVPVGVSVGLAALAVGAIASMKRGRLRNVEQN